MDEDTWSEHEEHIRETWTFEQKSSFFTSNPIKTYPIDLKINILATFDILNMILGSDLHKKQSNLLDLIWTVPSQKPQKILKLNLIRLKSMN